MLATESNMLKIYLIYEDMEIGCPPLELTEELSIFCGIENPEHIRLLSHILVQKDIRRIEKDLNRREVPDNIPMDVDIDPETEHGECNALVSLINSHEIRC